MTDDPFHYRIDYTAIPETQTVMWREGWGDRINHATTAIYNFREAKIRQALIELGWTPPDALRDVHKAGYDSGFYSSGNYFPEQAWKKYEGRCNEKDA